MARYLERLIPTLSRAVATAEIPARERNGGRTRRQAFDRPAVHAAEAPGADAEGAVPLGTALPQPSSPGISGPLGSVAGTSGPSGWGSLAGSGSGISGPWGIAGSSLGGPSGTAGPVGGSGMG